MVEQWNNDGETVQQRWWNSGAVMVEQWNSESGTLEQRWWKSGTIMVDSRIVMVEQ